MARIVNEPQGRLSFGEEIMAEFAKNRLPDYISVALTPSIHGKDGQIMEFDMLIFVPHMGIYILDIKNVTSFAYSEGTYRYVYSDGRSIEASGARRQAGLKQQVYALRDYLKEKFNITPLVYEFECFPGLRLKGFDSRMLPPDFDTRHVITMDDLDDELGFLRKIIDCTIDQKAFWANDTFEDLSDKDVHDIFFFWETGIKLPPRPDRPPVVFLSYNRMNNEMSKDVQTILEDRHAFVWRAPKDVPAGRDYFPNEMAAIEECDLFLILLSSSAQESEEVRKEFSKAVELNKTIFPVWVEDISDSDINDYYRLHLAKYQYRVMPKIDYDVISEIVATAKQAKKDNDAKLIRSTP
ncbi:MAG: toll/interleukin-1 receptor domain-containing protein [Butyrivibrio sp.]|nr:toll/interleukin-1 receptor domain-containing protein [Butyrivibrio sp.]